MTPAELEHHIHGIWLSIWFIIGVTLLLTVLILIAVHMPVLAARRRRSREPITPERERLDRLERLQRAVTDALYSTREARIWTCDEFADLDAVRAMRERLGFASDSLVSAQREVTDWLRVAVAKERADA